jgi:hypothetical protein
MPKSKKERIIGVKSTLGIAAAPTRANLYLGILKNNPTINNSAAGEPSGGSYARATVPASAWTVDADGTAVNNTNLTISAVPVDDYAFWGLFTAATGGDLVFFDALPFPFNSETAGNLTIAPGNISIAEF